MARSESIRLERVRIPGDGPEHSPHGGESPFPSTPDSFCGEAHPSADSLSFFAYLTDYQLGGIAVFCVVHEHCDEVDFVPLWDWSLSEVLEMVVICPSCAEERTYRMEGGE